MIRMVAALIGACLAMAACAAHAATLKDFASGPSIFGVAMSESGRYVAVAGPGKTFNDSQVTVIDFSAGKPKGFVTPFPGVAVASISWKGDARMVVKIVKRDVEVTGVSKDHPLYGEHIPVERTLAMNPDGTQPVVLFGDSRRLIKRAMMGQPIASLLPADPTHVLMAAFDGETVNLYRVDVMTGEYEKAERGEQAENKITIDWQADADGFAWLRTYMMRDGTYGAEVRPRDGVWRPVSRFVDISDKSVEFLPLAIAEDGSSFYAAMRAASDDKMGLYLVGLANGSQARRVFARPEVDIGGAEINDSASDFGVFNAYTGRLNGVRYAIDVPKVHFLNANWGKAQAMLEEAYPGQSVLIVSHARDFSRAVVEISGAASPPAYFIYEAATAQLTPLLEAYPALAGTPLGQTRMISYASSDGTIIKALLTLPPGGKTGLPLVVMPHGGPEARDVAAFDPLFVQGLVSRGYAVIQPQFRGSGGYGKAWADAGRLKWHTIVLDDIAGAVTYATSQGIADAKRVCIFGWSYGGYAAIASAAFRPGTYACAVGGAGIYDLVAMLRWEREERGADAYKYWTEQIGKLTDDNSGIDAQSAANNAGAIAIPVMLIHGDKDEVVPIEQARAMDAALKAAGKPSSLVVLEGEGHHLERYASRLKFLESLVGFLDANIGR